jgi:hypothetical protein
MLLKMLLTLCFTLLHITLAFHVPHSTYRTPSVVRAAFFEEQLPIISVPTQLMDHPKSTPGATTKTDDVSNDSSPSSTSSPSPQQREKSIQRRRFVTKGFAALATGGTALSTTSKANAFDPISFFAPYPAQAEGGSSPIAYSDDSIMDKKEHGKRMEDGG